MNDKELMKKLQEPFPQPDIEWRVGSCGKQKSGDIWATCLAYVSNRAIQNRLDEVFGPTGWQNEYRPGPKGGLVCGISVDIVDREGQDGDFLQPVWVTKYDGADNTDFEPVKGGLSDAMKRAAVQWGIGRYLYKLEMGFATISSNGKYRGKTKEGVSFEWDPPKLPEWAVRPDKEPRDEVIDPENVEEAMAPLSNPEPSEDKGEAHVQEQKRDNQEEKARQDKNMNNEEGSTKAQITKINTIINEAIAKVDRAMDKDKARYIRLDIIESVLQKYFKSWKNKVLGSTVSLTKFEASKIIDQLEQSRELLPESVKRRLKKFKENNNGKT